MTSIGCIKWFDTKKGFGFLTDVNTKKDVFVHFSSIKTDEDDIYKILYEGEYVSFEETLDDKKRTVTSSVTGVNGGKLLCENDYFKKLQAQFKRRNTRRVVSDDKEKDN